MNIWPWTEYNYYVLTKGCILFIAVFVPPPPHFFGNTLDKPDFPAWNQKILNKSRDLRLSKYMLRGQCLPSLFCPLYMLALPTLRSTPEASSYTAWSSTNACPTFKSTHTPLDYDIIHGKKPCKLYNFIGKEWNYHSQNMKDIGIKYISLLKYQHDIKYHMIQAILVISMT